MPTEDRQTRPQLGEKLAAKAPGENFPYQSTSYHGEVKAFALPGGLIFVTRDDYGGKNEGELAGVIAHEVRTSLAAGRLRSRKRIWQKGIGIVGSIFGGGGEILTSGDRRGRRRAAQTCSSNSVARQRSRPTSKAPREAEAAHRATWRVLQEMQARAAGLPPFWGDIRTREPRRAINKETLSLPVKQTRAQLRSFNRRRRA